MELAASLMMGYRDPKHNICIPREVLQASESGHFYTHQQSSESPQRGTSHSLQYCTCFASEILFSEYQCAFRPSIGHHQGASSRPLRTAVWKEWNCVTKQNRYIQPTPRNQNPRSSTLSSSKSPSFFNTGPTKLSLFLRKMKSPSSPPKYRSASRISPLPPDIP